MKSCPSRFLVGRTSSQVLVAINDPAVPDEISETLHGTGYPDDERILS